MAKIRAWLVPSVVMAALASWSAVGRGGRDMTSSPVPVAQAVTNVEVWIKAHPQDGKGYYTSGRIRALAWAYGDKIPLMEAAVHDELPYFSVYSTILVSRTGPGEPHWNANDPLNSEDRKDRPVTADDAGHLAASIAAYRKAIALDANDALSELGLGWMLAQQGLYARQLPADYWADPKPAAAEKAAWIQAIGQLSDENPKVRDTASQTLLAVMPRCVLVLRDAKSDDPETNARIDLVLRRHFDLQALDHYRKAFTLRAPDDLKAEPKYRTDTQVSAKAGTQILAVLAKYPGAAGKGEVKSVQDVLEPLAKKMEKTGPMVQ
jgi:hypothetical protein